LLSSSQHKNRRNKRYTQMSEINVTPFVDVMLVLLIVFMVTAPLLTVGIPVNLPKVKAGTLADQEAPIVITVNINSLYLDTDEVEPDKLQAILTRTYELNPDAIVYLKGDEVVSYGRIMEVLAMVKLIGFRIALEAENP